MKRQWWMIVLAAWLQINSALAAQPVQSFEPDSFRNIVAAHRGQAFVVMLWSLDCEYCEASFKALHEESRRSGLAVVAVATDSALDAQTVKMVSGKVRASGLDAQLWAFGAASPERLRYAIDPKWRGELPRTYWFDRQGRMRAYSGVVTPDVAQSLHPGR